jgi:hypothetical protein
MSNTIEIKKSKICKHYVMTHCKKGNSCDFDHVDNVCRDYFMGDCSREDTCKFKHLTNSLHTNGLHANNSNNTNNHRKRISPYGIKKNTESFEPWYEPADMRIMLGNGTNIEYGLEIKSRDVIIVPNLFTDMGDVYNKILDEIDAIKHNDKIWVNWHGDTHLIANDHENWKTHSQTFNKVIECISKYFKMNVKATRLNWYDSASHKPKHFDAAAIDEKKALTQNFTVGVSFGETRSVEFEHAKTRTSINISLSDGSTYAFSKDVNVQWRHGIPPLEKEKQSAGNGRISIIAWGYLNMTDI